MSELCISKEKLKLFMNLFDVHSAQFQRGLLKFEYRVSSLKNRWRETFPAVEVVNSTDPRMNKE